MTTTKKILFASWFTFLGLVICTLCGYDVGTPLEIMGGVVASIVTGFYMWKSKCENREKIAYGSVEKIADKYGIDKAIEITEVILKE